MPFELNICKLQLEGVRSVMCIDGDVSSVSLDAALAPDGLWGD
jgi:hypothetical protein